MTTETSPAKPSRTPWIIAGVLGCLVLCLVLALVGVGAYAVLSPGRPAAVVQTGPTLEIPIQLPPTAALIVPTQAPLAQPTEAPTAQPPSVQLTETPTAQPTASSGAVAAPAPVEPTTGASGVAPVAPVPVEPATGASGVAPVAPALPTAGSGAAPTAGAVTAPTTGSAAAGKIAFSVRQGDRPEDKYVWIMNVDGSGAKKILDRASEPTFSPDGTKIAYYHWTDGIFVVNADGSGAPGTKIIGDTVVGFIEWSHDGRSIAFSAQPGGTGNIVVNIVPPDGSALKDSNARRLVSVGKSPSWSPDDTQFAIDSCDTANHCGIFKVSSAGGPITPIVTDGGGTPAWSPNGNQIVYQTSVDAQTQLFLINVDGSGKKQLTQGLSAHVGATWSPDGSFIFYRTPESGTWGIWRMNADGTSPTKLIDNVAPVNEAFERLAITR